MGVIGEPEHIVRMLVVTRREFQRALWGIPDREAMVRAGGMNSVSWIVGHVAWQEDLFWRHWAQGLSRDTRLAPYGYGEPPSAPDFQEMLALWREVAEATEPYLRGLSPETLTGPWESPEGENLGTLVVRCLMHYWSHIGEISAIRTLLGIAGPQFVGSLRDCVYTV